MVISPDLPYHLLDPSQEGRITISEMSFGVFFGDLDLDLYLDLLYIDLNLNLTIFLILCFIIPLICFKLQIDFRLTNY